MRSYLAPSLARRCASLAALGACTLLAFPAAALSSTQIALDLDGNASAEDGVDPGAGGQLRFGQKFDLVLLALTPELGGGYHKFGGAGEIAAYRGFIGGRVGIGAVLEPSVFGHVGVAHVATAATDWTAPSFDAGVALDLTLLPLLDLGAHASYNGVFATSEQEAFNYFVFGLHAALLF